MRLVALIALALFPVTAHAQTTTTYTYDALGRLLKVESPVAGNTTYTYDAANNRTSVVKTAPAVTPPTGKKVIVLPLLGFVVIPID